MKKQRDNVEVTISHSNRATLLLLKKLSFIYILALGGIHPCTCKAQEDMSLYFFFKDSREK